MAINPSIPLSYRPPQIESPADSLQRALTLKQMMDEAAARPQELALRQEQLASLQYEREQKAIAKAEDQRLRAEAQRQKERLGIIGGVKKDIGNAAGLFLLHPDGTLAKQAYQQALDGIIKQFNMTPEEQQGLLKTLGSPEEFSVDKAEQILQGGADQHLLPMADYLIKTRGPTLMTDEGEIVQGGQEGGEFVPTGPVAEEGAEWYTQPYGKWTTDQKRNFGRIFNMGLAAKAWKKSDPTLTLPNGVTVDNPYYWQSKEKLLKLQAQYKKPDTVLLNKDTYKAEKDLRDEFKTGSKAYIAVRDAYERIRTPLEKAMQSGKINAAETLSAATSFMKLLDPESVVRESELNMALNSTGVADRLLNTFNTLRSGKVLTHDQVANFLQAANELYAVAERNHSSFEDQYSQLAEGYELDPKKVIIDYRPRGRRKKPVAPQQAPATQAKQPLKAGQELEGMPSPADAPNAIIRAPDGSRYKSDGKRWNKL
jgi:hypothetical protein